jgi:hypothetical protein
MVEVNRRLYMDEKTGERLPGFGGVRDGLASSIRRVAAAIR